MGFLLVSILLSVGLTVLLNWGLRHRISRAQRNDVDDRSAGASCGWPPDVPSDRGAPSGYPYGERARLASLG